jgi:hypothetical protein
VRAAVAWLARGDNSFHVVLFATLPLLTAVVGIGFF